MQQIVEFLFVAAFFIFVSSPQDAQPGIFENGDDIFGRSVGFRSSVHDQLPANLLDFRGCVALLG